MSEKVNCRYIETQLLPFLKGNLEKADAFEIQAHLRECSQCHQAFLRAASHGIVEAQKEFRAGVKGTLWSRLGTQEPWFEEERKKIREALELVLPYWRLHWSQELEAFTSGIGELQPVTMSPEKLWSSEVKVPWLSSSGEPGQKLVVFEVVNPPKIRNGKFSIVLRSEEDLEGSTLLCTVEAVRDERISFEGELRQEDNGPAWRVEIEATGIPVEEEEIVIPKDWVHFYLRPKREEQT